MKLEKNTKTIFIILGILLAVALFKNPTLTIESFSILGSQTADITFIGIPLLLLLLIPVYGIYVSIKNRYNPFKMWGSWVGAIILFLSLYLPYTLGGGCSMGPNGTSGDCNIFSLMLYFTNIFTIIAGGNYFVSIIIYTILGFLLGWGIHSLLIKFRILRK